MLERDRGEGEGENFPVLSTAPRSRILQGRLYRRAHTRQLQTAEGSVGLSNISGDTKRGMVPSTDGSNCFSKSEASIHNFLIEDELGSLGMMELGETTACS